MSGELVEIPCEWQWMVVVLCMNKNLALNWTCMGSKSLMHTSTALLAVLGLFDVLVNRRMWRATVTVTLVPTTMYHTEYTVHLHYRNLWRLILTWNCLRNSNQLYQVCMIVGHQTWNFQLLYLCVACCIHTSESLTLGYFDSRSIYLLAFIRLPLTTPLLLSDVSHIVWRLHFFCFSFWRSGLQAADDRGGPTLHPRAYALLHQCACNCQAG